MLDKGQFRREKTFVNKSKLKAKEVVLNKRIWYFFIGEQ